jgi:hypothetical protein
MSPLDPTGQLAAETIRERVRLGSAARLAALARCCQPTAWRRAARRLAATRVSLARMAPRRASVCC